MTTALVLTDVSLTDSPADQIDGWEIVHAIQGGDRQSYGLLYQRYSADVHRYFIGRVKNVALAEDLTSETFFRALRSIESVSYRGSDIRCWLISIARNLALDHFKAARTRHEVTTHEIARFSTSVAGPEEYVIAAAQRDQLMRGLALLTAEQRRCIVLRFMDELSVLETAETMGRDVRAVRALQHRAIRRLATQLRP